MSLKFPGRVRRAGLVVMILASAVLAGCAPTRPESRPTGDESALAPLSLAERGWARMLAGETLAAAEADLRTAIADLPGSGLDIQQARLGLGWVELQRAAFDQALLVFAAAVEAAPESDEALSAIHQLQELAGQVPDGHRRLEPLARAWLAHSPPAPVARGLRELLRQGARRSGDHSEAAHWDSEMGVPPLWRVSFPWGSHALLAFDGRQEPAGPLVETAGRPLLVGLPEDGRLVLDASEAEGLAWAECGFRLERPQSVWLRLEGEGPWAASLDGQEVAMHDVHRRPQPRVVRLRLDLDTGWHRLRVGLSAGAALATLGVELTAGDGSPLQVEWWRDPTAPSPEPTGSTLRSTPEEPPYRRLAERAVSRTNAAAVLVLASLLAWDDGATLEARQLAERARQHAPHFALATYLEALLLLESGEVPAGIAAANARRLLEAVRSQEQRLVRFRLALLDAEAGQEERALAGLRGLDTERPESFLWPLFSARILARLGWESEAEQAFRLAHNRLPDHPELLQQSFERAAARGDVTGATVTAERLEALDSPSEALADFWNQIQQPTRARAALERLVERQPSRPAPCLALVDHLLRRDEPAAAGRAIESCAAHTPDRLEIGRRRAEWLDRTGQPLQAQWLRLALSRRAPWNLPLRRATEIAAGRGPLVVAGEIEQRLPELLAAYRSSAMQRTGPAVLVLDRAASEIAPDGTSLERVEMLVQVLSPEGLDRWGEIEDLPAGAALEKLATVGADGRVREAQPVPGKESITLPGLKLGDFVLLSWVQGLRGRSPLRGSHVAPRFYFRTADSPIFRSIFTLSIPPGTEPVVDRHGSVPEPRRERWGEFERLVFEEREQAALKPEPNSAPLEEWAPWIQAGFGLDWAAYRAVLRTDLLAAARPTLELIRFAHRAVAGAPDERQGIERLFRAVCSAVRVSGDDDSFRASAAETLSTREGNRTVLLFSLLRALGYEPQLLLVRPVTAAQTDFALPNAGVYNHGLLRVQPRAAGSAPVWLDPSERFNAFDTLYDYLVGMQALEVYPGGGELFTRLPAATQSPRDKSIELELQLSADGALSGTGRETIASSQAVAYREMLSRMDDGQRRRALEAGLGLYFAGAVLREYRIGALDRPERPLVLDYRFQVAGFGRREGDRLVLRGGFYPYQLGPNLITGPQRQTPLLLGDETRTRTEVRLRLPAGARLTPPGDATLFGPLSEFRQRVRFRDGVLSLSKSLLVKPGRVSPEEYPAFLDFCRRVDRKDAEDLEIRLPPSP